MEVYCQYYHVQLYQCQRNWAGLSYQWLCLAHTESKEYLNTFKNLGLWAFFTSLVLLMETYV